MKKRAISALLSLCLLLTLTPCPTFAAEVANGTISGSITWSLDDSGLLTISGSGAIPENYTFTENAADIRQVHIGNGIAIPATNTALFSQLPNLTAFSVDAGSTSFSVDGSGVLYDKDGTNLIRCPQALSGSYRPSSGTAIRAYAFQNCTVLTGVEIPDGVTDIGNNAFQGCTSLQTVTFAGTSSLTAMAADVFQGCTSLTDVTIPAGVTTIGSNAFDGCTSLQTVTFAAGSGLTAILSNAFTGCTSLTGIAIPTGVTAIGSGAFKGCTSLTGFDIPANVTAISDGTFHGCSALTAVTIPDGVTHIGKSAFEGCSALTAITLPSGVMTLSTGAFANCTGLTAVTVPGSVKIIPGNADAGDTSTLPCFYGCRNLKTVTLQSGVTTLEARAFQLCDALTTLEIPATVTTLGEHLVNSNQLNVYYHGTSDQWGSLTTTTNNPILKGETTSVLYAGAAATLTATSDNATTDPTVTIESDRPFLNDGLAGKLTLGGTAASGLTVRSCTLEGSGKTLKLSLAGSSTNGGELTVTVQPSAFAGPSGFTPVSTVGGVYLPTPSNPGPAGYTITLKCIYSTGGNLSGGNWTESVSGGSYSISLRDASSSGFAPKTVEVEGGGNIPSITDHFTSRPQLNGTIGRDQTITITYYPFYDLTVNYLCEDGSQASIPYSGPFFEGDTYNVTPPAVTGYTFDPALVTGTMPNKNLTVTVTYSPSSTEPPSPTETPSPADSPSPSPADSPSPSPTAPSGGGGGGGTQRVPPPTPTSTPAPAAMPDLGTSPIQGAVKKEEFPNWIDRLETPRDALTFYEAMAGRSKGQTSTARLPGVLQREELYTLPAAGSGSGVSHQVEQIEIVDFSLLDLYAQEGGALTGTVFTDESFFTVPANAEDRKIDYPNLTPGSAVRTANFNGVYVTKIVKGDDFDAKKKESCEYIAAVYQAFDRDCPEIFWLSGKCRVRVMSAKDPATGVTNAYFFLVTADKEGFSMRSPAWAEAGAIQAGIQRRDAAVAQILTTVTSGEVVGQVRQLNQWITEHNQYNTSADLNAIDNEPHECLSALEGRIAEQGPVCDGYSKAFKVLCDRLGIPCVLETGWARPSAESAGEFHMWSNVKVAESWFGADVTWNDPSVKGFVGAKSGKESEEFLLVGADTVIREVPFAQSHVVKNQAAVGGVDFSNGPILSSVAFSSLPAYSGYYVSLFDDLPVEHWAAEAAAWAKSMGYMLGVSDTRFGPEQSLSRGQLWTILARMAGQDPKSYEELLDWAAASGLTDGTQPGSSADRQQMVTLLYRWAGEQGMVSPAAPGALEGWRDGGEVAPWAREAMEWAVSAGLISGTEPGTLSPRLTVTRAQFAVILQRLFRQSASAA